jgi:methionyl-tRNA formyltransferase
VAPSPVKQAALDLGLAVTESVADVVDAGVELGVVVAFGQLVRPEVLAQVPMVNVHFSLLPRWRGAAPVERAILAGDSETGVCIMGLEEGLDTGPVFARQAVRIGTSESAADLRSRLGALGTELLLGLLAGGGVAGAVGQPQIGEPSYAAKLRREELEIDWSSGAEAIGRLVRVGRAWTSFRSRRLVVRAARPCAPGTTLVDVAPDGPVAASPGSLWGDIVATGDGLLQLIEVQAEGRRVQPFEAWAAGAHPAAGEHLGR